MPEEQTIDATAVAEEESQVSEQSAGSVDASEIVEEESSPLDNASPEKGAHTDPTPEKPEGDWIPKSRFNEVYAKMRTYEDKAKKYEQSQSQSEEDTQQQRPSGGESPKGEPRLEDYEFDTERYTDAKIEWKLQQLKIKEQREKERAEGQRRQQSFYNQVREKAASDPAYKQAIETHGDLRYSEALQKRILSSENGAELDAYFYKNLHEFDRINSLPPEDAIEELGVLKATLSRKDTRQQGATRTTAAPEPIEQVTGGASKSEDPIMSNYTVA